MKKQSAFNKQLTTPEMKPNIYFQISKSWHYQEQKLVTTTYR